MAALDGATSMSQVVERLRLSRGGAAYVTVRSRMEQLGLDRPAPRGVAARGHGPVASTFAGPQRRWSDADLQGAVRSASSLRQVFTFLGLEVGGSQWAIMRARIKALGLDTSHWRLPLDARSSCHTDELVRRLCACDLVTLVATHGSRAELLRSLGLAPNATTYGALRRALARSGIPATAINGRRKGGTKPTPLADILVRHSTWTNSARLRSRLIAEGHKADRCEACGLTSWQGRPAPLQLDHVDGDRTNNELSNLRILCANCHALTATWGVLNRGRPNRSSASR